MRKRQGNEKRQRNEKVTGKGERDRERRKRQGNEKETRK